MKIKKILLSGLVLGAFGVIQVNQVHASNVTLSAEDMTELKRTDLTLILRSEKENVDRLIADYLASVVKEDLLSSSVKTDKDSLESVLAQLRSTHFSSDLEKQQGYLVRIMNDSVLTSVGADDKVVTLAKALLTYKTKLEAYISEFGLAKLDKLSATLGDLIYEKEKTEVKTANNSVMFMSNKHLVGEKLQVKQKAEEERIAQEKKAEEERIAREKAEARANEVYIIPVDNAYVTSGYGEVRSLTLQDGRIRNDVHTGIDYVNGNSRAEIHASKSGTVVYASWMSGGGGNTIVIRHDDGLYTMYAHLSAFKVKVGDEVAQRDVIGIMGTTGDSTGPHLHFGLAKGSMFNWVNPNNYLNKQ